MLIPIVIKFEGRKGGKGTTLYTLDIAVIVLAEKLKVYKTRYNHGTNKAGILIRNS